MLSNDDQYRDVIYYLAHKLGNMNRVKIEIEKMGLWVDLHSIVKNKSTISSVLRQCVGVLLWKVDRNLYMKLEIDQYDSR